MYVIYEGPGNYNQAPIVVIATKDSANPKTGDMWQTWIMHQDVSPHEAVKTGEDYAVCGNCPLRPLSYKANGLAKGCYVKTHFAPLSVWRKYKRDGYERIAPENFRALLDGKGIRLGSYGDPASVPYQVWESVGVGSGEFTHTAYTHGYLVQGFDARILDIAMVSLDPVTQQMDEMTQGRSFRVIRDTEDVRPDEILCPASKEQGYKTTCAQCGLCAGLTRKAKNIAIVIH